MKLTVHTLYFGRLENNEPVLNVRWRKKRGQDRKPQSKFRLAGELLLLVTRYLHRQPDQIGYQPSDMPIGIWLDRLQEEPSELVGATAEEVEAILTELRRGAPNGT